MTYLMPRLDETARGLARRSSPNYRPFVTEFVIEVMRTLKFATNREPISEGFTLSRRAREPRLSETARIRPGFEGSGIAKDGSNVTAPTHLLFRLTPP